MPGITTEGEAILSWVKSIVLGVLALSAVFVTAVWAFFASDFFNGIRSTLIEQVLAEQIGYDLIINGDARVEPGITSKLILTDVSLPSYGIEGTNLAELAEVSLKSNTMDLLLRQPDFQALNMSGIKVNLVRSADNFVSWSDVRTAVRRNEDVAQTAVKAVDHVYKITKLLNFILSRSDAFDDINLNIINEKTGFEFDFRMDNVQFEHLEQGTRHRVSSVGAVNFVGFEFAGEFAQVGPFDLTATAGNLEVKYAGTRKSEEEGGGFQGQFDLNSVDISTFLNIMQLDTTYPGSIGFSASVENDGSVTSIRTFSTELNFTSGTQIVASGSIDDLQRVKGIDIDLAGRFYPEDRPPAAAGNVSELQLTEANGRITGNHEAFTVEDAVLKTNAFEEEIEEFGPIGIGQMRRSANNKLELLDVTLQAGLLESPFLRISGQISDALELRDYDFDGQIAAPAAIVLVGLDPMAAGQFGTINGSFAIDDALGFPRIPSLDVQTANTDLWALDVHAQSGESGEALDLEIDAWVRVTDTPTFLAGLGMSHINLSPLAFDMQAEAKTSAITGSFSIQAGQSEIASALALEVEDYTRELTGEITSDDLHVEDAQRLIALGIELGSVEVLTAETATPQAETVIVQPLILPEKEVTLQDLLAQEGVQPLMLPSPRLNDLLSPENILRHVDADIDIAVRKLTGVPGLSSVTGKLTAQEGVAQLGPLKARYRDGFISARAKMDVLNTPEVVEVAGTAGGWDFGKMLDSFGAGIGASGILNGSFGLKGPTASLRTFVNAMSGTVAIGMTNGSIDTSLLELAGLGVVPWLFTEEMLQGRTTITCLSAPFRINAGHVKFDEFVAETRRVQVVAKGNLDWRKDSVDIRAEPRPLGRPLARSAWPFTISGKLSDPTIKPEAGGAFRLLPGVVPRVPAARKACVPDIKQ